MTLIETGPGRWERADGTAPDDGMQDETPRAPREELSARVREALLGGTLDQLEEAIIRETVGYLTDPYIDSNTLMGVQDLNPRLAAAWNNGARDLGKDERRREVSRARLLSVFAPPAHNAVRQHQNYVICEGIAKPSAADADVQAIIDDLWTDPANYEFTTHAGQRRTAANQLIDGEIFVAIAVDDTDGHCKWRTVDPLDIDDIVTDPNDANRKLYYRVRATQTDYDFGEGFVKDDTGQARFIYYRDWRNTDPKLDPYAGKAQPAAPEHMVMAHWPLNVLGLRGIPDMVCAAPWITAHKSFMNNRTILHEALSKIAFVKTIKGGAAAIGASQLAEQSSLTNSQYSGQERNPQPAPYSIYTKSAGIDIEQMKVDSGASNAATDGEMLAQMFGTGIGLPTHYAIMSVEAHRLATATAMELPVLKMFLSAQQGWLDMLRDMIDFALLQAALAQRLGAKVVARHGRQMIDWDNSSASPKVIKLSDRPTVADATKQRAAPDDQTTNSDTYVREALEDNDATAAAAHIDDKAKPSAVAEQQRKRRGNYTIDMPPILQKDILQTIQAVVAALQAGTLTPEMAANQVMIALGFDDVSDKMDEWRTYVTTQAGQAVDRAKQEQQLAQQQIAAKAGAAAPPKKPGGASVREAAELPEFTAEQIEALEEAGVVVLRVREAAGGGHWITIEQDGETTHIFIGAHGMVTKGPKHLIGANIAHLPPLPGKRSVTHHAEGHTPEGHDKHPPYTEHKEKVHVFGKKGPGIGYDVDNPLPKKTKAEAEAGLDESIKALKEHAAAQQADDKAKADAEEAHKAAVVKKNSDALASATDDAPHAVTTSTGNGTHHVVNAKTLDHISAHDNEDEAHAAAAKANDAHVAKKAAEAKKLAALNTLNESLKKGATEQAPYVANAIKDGEWTVINGLTGEEHEAILDHYDSHQAAKDAAAAANKHHVKPGDEAHNKALDELLKHAETHTGQHYLHTLAGEIETKNQDDETLASDAFKHVSAISSHLFAPANGKAKPSVAELQEHVKKAAQLLVPEHQANSATHMKDALANMTMRDKMIAKEAATHGVTHDTTAAALHALAQTPQGNKELHDAANEYVNQHFMDYTGAPQDVQDAMYKVVMHHADPATHGLSKADLHAAIDKAVPQLTAGKAANDAKPKLADTAKKFNEKQLIEMTDKVKDSGYTMAPYVTLQNPQSGEYYTWDMNSASDVTQGYASQADADANTADLVSKAAAKLHAQTQQNAALGEAVQLADEAYAMKQAKAKKPYAVYTVHHADGNTHYVVIKNKTGAAFSAAAVSVHTSIADAQDKADDFNTQAKASTTGRDVARDNAPDVPKYSTLKSVLKKASKAGKASATFTAADKDKLLAGFEAALYKGTADGTVGQSHVTREAAKQQIMYQRGQDLERLGLTATEAQHVMDKHLIGAPHPPEDGTETPHERVASHFTSLWASTSADSHAKAVAMQRIADEMFGTEQWTAKPEHVADHVWNDAEATIADPIFRKAAERYLHACYHATQAEFKKNGVTHVPMFRGVKEVKTKKIVDAAKAEQGKLLKQHGGQAYAMNNSSDHWQTEGTLTGAQGAFNPMSSWALDASTASDFAGSNHDASATVFDTDGVNAVFSSLIPVERILSTFRTGYGCLHENEFVVLGHALPTTYHVGRVRSRSVAHLDKKLVTY